MLVADIFFSSFSNCNYRVLIFVFLVGVCTCMHACSSVRIQLGFMGRFVHLTWPYEEMGLKRGRKPPIRSFKGLRRIWRIKGRYSNLRPIIHKSFNSLKRTISV